MKKVIGIVMVVLGALASIIWGSEWWSIASGRWVITDAAGVVQGPGQSIILTVAGIAVLVGGIVVLVRSSKAKKEG